MPSKDREVRNATERRYYAKNADRLKAEASQRYLDKREEKLTLQKAYYAANKKEILLRMADPEKKERSRTTRKIFRAINHKEILERERQYRVNNPEKIRNTIKKYKENNPEKVKETQKKYWDANPEKYYAKHARWRARKRMALINDFTAGQWILMKISYNNRCFYCGEIKKRLSQDHVVPLSKNGDHTASNIVPACRSCNSKKNDKVTWPTDYRFSPVTECA